LSSSASDAGGDDNGDGGDDARDDDARCKLQPLHYKEQVVWFLLDIKFE
jgi:hypothetical protein